ncbi:GumC family protein [Nereida ignava]|uniref:GumC family protein n=1 Tax=Nereida ignava TaxID=282199 RepID=UPI0030F85C12
MSNHQPTDAAEDEINLKELFLTIWAYKFLIALVSSVFLVGAGFYALNADKVYSAKSTFALPGGTGSSGILGSLGGELGGLATLVGAPTGGGDAEVIVERLTSREFILEIARELDLINDEMFNSYDPNATGPAWKAVLKSLLGMVSEKPNANRIALQNVINAYKDHIAVGANDTGSISVTVDHEVPERAAEIANHIVSKIIALKALESSDETDEKLEYLSRTLADASEDLEVAQGALKQYSLENSIQAVDSFALGSVMLDDMRVQRDQSAEQLEAALALKDVLSKGVPSEADYDRLRQEFPQLDQPSFRRIMGVSEVASAWTWPSVEVVSQVESSIRDRLSALERDILKLEGDALKYASSAERLAELTRDLRIAEAAYTVLIEQVKSQSLVAGFRPDNSRILEVADVPTIPTEPKRTLILALGLVLGVFVGSAVALVLGMRRGVYFALSSLLEASGVSSGFKVNSVRRFRGKPLADVHKSLGKIKSDWARRAVLQFDSGDENRPVFICDLSFENNAGALAKIVAATAVSLGRDVGFVDLSHKLTDIEGELTPDVADAMAKVGSPIGGTEYVYPVGAANLDLLYSRSVNKIVDALLEKHDIVIFAANTDAVEVLLASNSIVDPVFGVQLKPGKTLIKSVQRMLQRGTLGVAFHA